MRAARSSAGQNLGRSHTVSGRDKELLNSDVGLRECAGMFSERLVSDDANGARYIRQTDLRL